MRVSVYRHGVVSRQVCSKAATAELSYLLETDTSRHHKQSELGVGMAYLESFVHLHFSYERSREGVPGAVQEEPKAVFSDCPPRFGLAVIGDSKPTLFVYPGNDAVQPQLDRKFSHLFCVTAIVR